MKKIFCFVVVVALMIFFTGVAFAGDLARDLGKTAVKAGYDKIYEINLPSDVSNSNIVQNVQEGSWYCDDDQSVEVKYRDINYYYAQKVTELNKWNAGKVSLTGQESQMGIENLIGYLSFDPPKKIVYIGFAYQGCSQQVISQTYDEALGKWICTTSSDFICYDVYYYDLTKLILTIEPYLNVR